MAERIVSIVDTLLSSWKPLTKHRIVNEGEKVDNLTSKLFFGHAPKHNNLVNLSSVDIFINTLINYVMYSYTSCGDCRVDSCLT